MMDGAAPEMAMMDDAPAPQPMMRERGAPQMEAKAMDNAIADKNIA